MPPIYGVLLDPDVPFVPGEASPKPLTLSAVPPEPAFPPDALFPLFAVAISVCVFVFDTVVKVDDVVAPIVNINDDILLVEMDDP